MVKRETKESEGTKKLPQQGGGMVEWPMCPRRRESQADSGGALGRGSSTYAPKLSGVNTHPRCVHGTAGRPMWPGIQGGGGGAQDRGFREEIEEPVMQKFSVVSRTLALLCVT